MSEAQSSIGTVEAWYSIVSPSRRSSRQSASPAPGSTPTTRQVQRAQRVTPGDLRITMPSGTNTSLGCIAPHRPLLGHAPLPTVKTGELWSDSPAIANENGAGQTACHPRRRGPRLRQAQRTGLAGRGGRVGQDPHSLRLPGQPGGRPRRHRGQCRGGVYAHPHSPLHDGNRGRGEGDRRRRCDHRLPAGTPPLRGARRGDRRPDAGFRRHPRPRGVVRRGKGRRPEAGRFGRRGAAAAAIGARRRRRIRGPLPDPRQVRGRAARRPSGSPPRWR